MVRRSIGAALLACPLAALAAAQSTAPALTLVGLDGTTKVLSVVELQALPQIELTESSPATGTVRFRGPTVRGLVSLVGAPEGHALRGPSMAIVVLAEASDGYKVAYSLAELDEQFGARSAIVALTQDGKPLPATYGPLRIIVGAEAHHARWIRQLTTLRLVLVGATVRGGLTSADAHAGRSRTCMVYWSRRGARAPKRNLLAAYGRNA